MRAGLLAAVATVALAWSNAGCAQSYYAPGGNPCLPPPTNGNLLNMLVNSAGQARRDAACAAYRQAQWADYNARKKAAEDQAATEAAAQQEQQAAAERAQAEASRRQAAAEVREHRREEDARAEAKREEIAAAEHAKARYIALVAAENSSENYCKQPKVARGLLDQWNDLDAMKESGIKVIDIEHLTTSNFHPDDQSMSCHGVFVTTRGMKIVGTGTIKRNVAGDPMFVWEPDSNQNLAAYNAPPGAESPELVSQTKVGSSSTDVTRVTPASASPDTDH
jgi:hypothetical protein